jgi:hypothetical protein
VTYEEAIAEVKERGFDDLSETRIGRWLNEAVGEVVDYGPWPFNEETKEGTAPLTFTDLGHVLSVSNKQNELQLSPLDRRQVIAVDPAMVAKGIGECWYREGEKIAVWPADTTSTFIVRYQKAPKELTGAEALPGPVRFHGLYVDGAVVRGFKNRSNFEAAQFVRQEWERVLREMVMALLNTNYDMPKKVSRSGWAGDYIY